MNNLIELDEKDYMEKKFQAAKEILPTLLSQYPPEYVIDKKKRGSVIYNCVAIAGALLDEVGYIPKGKPHFLGGGEDDSEDKTAIRNLGDLLKEDQEE